MSEYKNVPTLEQAPPTLQEQLDCDMELAGFDFSKLEGPQRFLSWTKTIQ